MFKFRFVKASEIECRISQINEYYTHILLYKDARCDQNILDETVGPMNWQKSYSRDNANCTVSIWDDEKKQWISKEDTGTESNTEKEKGLASDSFKRACVNWGIGRELYTAPNIQFSTKDLHEAKADSTGRWKDYDKFIVSSISYTAEGYIDEVTIDVADRRGVYLTRTFKSERAERAKKDASVSYPVPAVSSAPAEAAAVSGVPEEIPLEPIPETPVPETPMSETPTETKPKVIKSPVGDSVVILIGDLKGKTYGEVKNTPEFVAFLKEAANGKVDPGLTEDEQKQYSLFKSLGQQVFG
ncbi:MAG: hypothetical protein ACI4CS_04345, partial [Candidatus Weimeria sp.]